MKVLQRAELCEFLPADHPQTPCRNSARKHFGSECSRRATKMFNSRYYRELTFENFYLPPNHPQPPRRNRAQRQSDRTALGAHRRRLAGSHVCVCVCVCVRRAAHQTPARSLWVPTLGAVPFQHLAPPSPRDDDPPHLLCL